MDNSEEFMRQCDELGNKLIDVMSAYPQDVTAMVLPGVLAAVMYGLGLQREAIIAALDSALADVGDGPETVQ